MPETSICRLCASLCHDYKQLYEDVEVYEITVKYFDPMNVLMAQSYFDQTDANGPAKKSESPRQQVGVNNSDASLSPAKKLHNDSLLDRSKVCTMVHLPTVVTTSKTVDPPNELLNTSIAFKKEVGHDDDDLAHNLAIKKEIGLVDDDDQSYNTAIKSEKEAYEDDDDLDDNMLVPELLFQGGALESSYPTTIVPFNGTAVNKSFNQHSKSSKYISPVKENGLNSKARYATARELDRLIAQWKPTLECRICSKSYANFTVLRNHFTNAHSKAEFYISCCQRKFNLRSRLEEHLRLHSDPFQCEACGKYFKWKVTLSRHLRKCPEYNNAIQSKANVVQHKSNELDDTATSSTTDFLRQMFSVDENRKYKCNHCEKSYTSKCSLREHMVIHTGKDLYACQHCPVTFRYRSAWRVHQIREHPITRNGMSQTIRCKKSKHMDKIKQRIHIAKAVMAEHAPIPKTPPPPPPQQVHTPNPDRNRKHKCTLCEKSYTTGCSLREHMSLHTGQNLYSCQHCPRTFTYRSAWRMHQIREHPKTRKGPEYQNVKIIIKNPSKKAKNNGVVSRTTSHQSKTPKTNHLMHKFQCTLCERSYLHVKSLREHMITHTGKVFTCPHCPQTFKYRSAWRLHQKRFHSK